MNRHSSRSMRLVTSAILTAPLLVVLPGADLAQAQAPACGGTRDAYVGSTYRGTTKTTGSLNPSLLPPILNPHRLDTPSTPLRAAAGINAEAELVVKFTKDARGEYWANTTADGKVTSRSGYTLNLTGAPKVEFNAKMHEPVLHEVWQTVKGELKHIDKLDSVGKYIYGYALAAQNCPSGSQTPTVLASTEDNGFGLRTTTRLTRQG
ncbi:hypothetical protein [Streptomyces formicae]|uniref:Secreted protein n=1 Tax=Streptomyces formicae TaxID=1616117 RepID=A0A291QEK6_9ACTN|nr:hypothetical protein [Streptomyces formicae]ATL29998.1 hypothetical protein KY5_4980 [Streptomyces formicae]